MAAIFPGAQECIKSNLQESKFKNFLEQHVILK